MILVPTPRERLEEIIRECAVDCGLRPEWLLGALDATHPTPAQITCLLDLLEVVEAEDEVMALAHSLKERAYEQSR